MSSAHPPLLPASCAQVATLPKIVSKRWADSGVDVLVNNAGMSRSDASLFSGNVASWVEMLSTNVGVWQGQCHEGGKCAWN